MKNERRLYEVYVTDALKAITENTAKMCGGSSLKLRYADLLENSNKQEETRTAEDIISNIKNKINKMGG